MPSPSSPRASPVRERPAFVVGSDVYWAGAWAELAAAVEHLRVPVFTNGLGRGTLPADHELAFLRTRGALKQQADLVVVLGTPLDFRLGFGRFGVGRRRPRRRRRVAAGRPRRRAQRGRRHRRHAARPRRAHRRPRRPRGMDRRSARQRGGCAGRRGGAARRRRRADQADACLRRAAPPSRPRRRRHLRRWRLRLLRRQVRRGVRAGMLAGHRAVRLPRQRAGLLDRRSRRSPRRPDRRPCSAMAPPGSA